MLKTLVSRALMIFALWLGVVAVMLMAVDALEFETTGECRECVVLPKLSNRFNQ